MTRERFGRLDVVVNNAGYCVEGEIEAVPEEVARKEMDVLFWGLVHITKQVCSIQRHMPGLTFIQPVGHKDVNPPGHGGRILDISSVGGYRAWPGSNYYHAGKFALEAFTERFTKMLPEWNIKRVIIEPGGFTTSFTSDTSMIRIPMLPQ
ncbi:hypothetical protein AcV7_009471 [Taiwanofungus camphoratus]|nr:hypothetical protein AcV7_009471 [Antrodia cinnamomea]